LREIDLAEIALGRQVQTEDRQIWIQLLEHLHLMAGPRPELDDDLVSSESDVLVGEAVPQVVSEEQHGVLPTADFEEILRCTEIRDLDVLDRLRIVDEGHQLAVAVRHFPYVGDVQVIRKHPAVLEQVTMEHLERDLVPDRHVRMIVIDLVIEAERAEDRILPRSHPGQVEGRYDVEYLGLVGVPVAGGLELLRSLSVRVDKMTERVGLHANSPL
jgi:hypothetical protein